MVAEHSKMMGELKKTIDDQRVKISELNGVIKVQMENKILFPSGQAIVSDEGKEVLRKVAGGFGGITDKRFRIEGHTNIPQEILAFHQIGNCLQRGQLMSCTSSSAQERWIRVCLK